MPRLTVHGSIDPLLNVALEKGECIFAERNAIVSMDSTLALTGKAKGGLLSALSRKILNDESFFQQKIEAIDGDGEVFLTPTLPGDIAILQTGPQQFLISDGAYLAIPKALNCKQPRKVSAEPFWAIPAACSS